MIKVDSQKERRIYIKGTISGVAEHGRESYHPDLIEGNKVAS